MKKIKITQKTLNRMRKAGRILMMSFTLILAAGCAGGSMLEANADQVNNFLKTRTTATTGGGSYDTFTPDAQYLNENGSANTAALVKAHRDMGIRLAEEGSVLLKNNGTLPIKDSKITLMGYRSTKEYANYGMDIGSPEASSQNVCFQDALTEAGFSVNGAVCDAYNTVSATAAYTGMSVNRMGGTGYAVTSLTASNRYNIAEPTIDEIKSSAGSGFDSSIAEYNGAGIVVLGRPSSEQADYYTGNIGRNEDAFTQSTTKNILSLSDGERDLLEFAKEKFEKVVVVITTANAMELGDLEKDEGIDAILWAGYPGNYGFIGVANILAGKANPSGKLADTYAADSAASPAMQNWGLSLYTNYQAQNLATNDFYGAAYAIQAEGIYVGYKYYETRYEDAVLNRGNATSPAGKGTYNSGANWTYTEEVVYPFGYGLSYTKFTQEITGVTFSDDKRTATVSVSVENTGDEDGKSVVQVYGQSPYTAGGVEKPSVQLLAYEKIDVGAGATETVDVKVDMQYMASYDSTANSGAGTYVMDAGDYYFALGCNPNNNSEGAHAAINNILAAKGYSASNGMDVDGYAAAAHKFTFADWGGENNAFAKSRAGVDITNQLDDMDINHYKPGTVTYLSRNDWSGTWPKTYSVEASSDMLLYLKNTFHTLDTDGDVSEIVFGSSEGAANFTTLFGSGYDDERWAEVISKIPLAEAVRFSASGNRTFQGLDAIHFLSGGSYVENGSVGIQKTLSQQSDMNAPWYVSPDDPNAGYYCNSYGGATLMASTWNKDLMYEMGVLWGNDSLFINIPMVWAPSINLHRTPYNGRNGEYYSEDGVLSGYTALAIGSGGISKGLITSIKHFAFNTQETSRLGLSTFATEQAVRENELRGFQIALEGTVGEDGKRTSVLGIMTAYNRVGVTYAGAHTGLMQGILRGEWDFNGYATSDLAQSGSSYMPYVESILAGTTNFDSAINNDNTVWRVPVADLVSKIQNDPEVLSALKEDLHYSLWAFSQSNLANWMTDTTRVVWVWNWWRACYYSAEIISGIIIGGGFLMYVYSLWGHTLVEKLLNKKRVKESEQS